MSVVDDQTSSQPKMSQEGEVPGEREGLTGDSVSLGKEEGDDDEWSSDRVIFKIGKEQLICA